MRIFIILVICIIGVIGDCPAAIGPPNTQIGFIDARFTNPSNNGNQNFQYTLTKAFSSKPTVAIAINAMDFQFNNSIQFRILQTPTIQLTKIFFTVITGQQNQTWNRIKFAFLATTWQFLFLQTEYFNFENTAKKNNIYAAEKNIFLPSTITGKIKIHGFINGLSVSMEQSSSLRFFGGLGDATNLKIGLDKLSYQTQKRLFKFNVNVFSQTKLSNIFMNLIFYDEKLELTNQVLYESQLFIYNTQASVSGGNPISGSMPIPGFMPSPQQQISVAPQSVSIAPTSNNNVFAGGPIILNPSTPTSLDLKKSSHQISNLNITDFLLVGLQGFTFEINNKIKFQLAAQKDTQRNIKISLGSSQLKQNQNVQIGYFALRRKQQYKCAQCPNSPYLYNSACLRACPFNYVRSQKSNNALYCKYCNITEFLIANADGNQCVCPQKYFLDNKSEKCVSCHYTCLTCSEKNQNSCLSCDTATGVTKRIKGNKNTCVCQDGFYEDPKKISIKCLPCPQGCSKCTGKSNNQCSKCLQGRQKTQLGFCQCSNNYKLDQKGNCICPFPFILDNKICKLPTGSISFTQAGALQLCGANSIVNSIKNTCQCGINAFRKNGQCISCGTDQFFNQKLNRCECVKGNLIIQTNTCKQCGENEFYSNQKGKCLCKKNFVFDNNSNTCIKCPRRMQFIDEKCECIRNYYFDGKECIKCKTSTDGPKCVKFLGF